MHHSAYVNAEKFFEKYCKDNIENKKILDVGSYDVNGTMKPIFSRGQYIGLDMEEGPNVDVVGVSHDIPFKDDYFDVVISSSCFEHDDMFWISFQEMCRVLKPGGFMYVQAPQNGPYHGWPGDNWRFYADSWKALEKWGKKIGFNVELIETYIDETTPPSENEGDRIWNDSIGIYKKNNKIDTHFDLKTIEKGHHNTLYRGIKCLKNPFDYLIYQMIINEVKPDLIIEIGTHYGGNSVYMADLLEINKKGVLHTIDIENFNDSEVLNNHPRIKRFFDGFENYDLKLTEEFETILVIDDGSHQYHDVVKSLEKFKDIVCKNSYFIVEDGTLTELGYSEQHNGGPHKAILEFISNNDEFLIDKKWCDFFGKNATFNADGFLKKIK
jgi:cephalosporin hydroxylase